MNLFPRALARVSSLLASMAVFIDKTFKLQ